MQQTFMKRSLTPLRTLTISNGLCRGFQYPLGKKNDPDPKKICSNIMEASFVQHVMEHNIVKLPRENEHHVDVSIVLITMPSPEKLSKHSLAPCHQQHEWEITAMYSTPACVRHLTPSMARMIAVQLRCQWMNKNISKQTES